MDDPNDDSLFGRLDFECMFFFAALPETCEET